MKKIMVLTWTAVMTLATNAMPTGSELEAAIPMVREVVSADLDALKQGKKTASEVAETHMKLAAKAATPAERYLLLQGAYRLYTRGGDHLSAAGVLNAMVRDVPGVSPDILAEVISGELYANMKESAPDVFQIYCLSKRVASRQKDLKKVEKELETKPDDPKLNLELGECCAELGDWKRARRAFAKAGGQPAEFVAKESLAGSAIADAADYWWDYAKTDGFTIYRIHAADLYVRALTDPGFSGLARERAAKRVKELELAVAKMPVFDAMGRERCESPAWEKDGSGRMRSLKFDVGGGIEFAFENCPAGRASIEETRFCAATSYNVPRTFWMSKYPVTHGVWRQVMGLERKYDATTAALGGDQAAVIGPSYAEVRRFCAKLNATYGSQLPHGYVFRVPAWFEYMYAFKANAKADDDPYRHLFVAPENRPIIAQQIGEVREMLQKAGLDNVKIYNHKMIAVEKLDSYQKWGGGKVGQKRPNAWGLYDMVGIAEWFLLDTFGGDSEHAELTFDKNGKLEELLPDEFGNNLPYFHSEEGCRLLSNTRFGDCGVWETVRRDFPHRWYIGCRIVIGPDLELEAKCMAVRKRLVSRTLVGDKLPTSEPDNAEVEPKNLQTAVDGQLRYVLTNDAVNIVGVRSPSLVVGELEIPKEIGGCPVVEIGPNAFSACTGLVSVVIPSSVTNVAIGAFGGCGSIRTISVPQCILDVGVARVFPANLDSVVPAMRNGKKGKKGAKTAKAHNESITNVTYTSPVLTIPDGAFRRCNRLRSAEIPHGVTRIGNSAFEECRGLAKVVIPGSVTNIGRKVFSKCTSIVSIAIPQLVIDSGVACVFDASHTSITNIEYTTDITDIGPRAFACCSAMTSIDIPDGVRSIGSCAFLSCTGLVSVAIPASVTNVEFLAYCGCKSIRNIRISQLAVERVPAILFASSRSSIEHVGYTTSITNIARNAFARFDRLCEICIPEEVKTIGDGAFMGCKSLRDITIPEGVVKVGASAFSGCDGLGDGMIVRGERLLAVNGVCPEDVVIPAQVQVIVGGAFKGHDEIKSLTMPVGMSEIGSDAFRGCKSISKVYVDDCEGERERIQAMMGNGGLFLPIYAFSQTDKR